MVLSLLAQYADELPSTIPSAADSAAAASAGAAAVGIFGGVMLFAVVIGILSFAVWLWALIDVIRRNFANPSDKTLWLILVIVGAFFLGPILPIIYLIVGRKKGTIAGAKTA